MHVFRIEDKFGKGYKHHLDSDIPNWTYKGFYHTFIQNEDDYFKYRPMPFNDGIRSSLIRKYHIFGFKDIPQLNEWFLPADLAMAHLLGGKISVYEVNQNKVISGNRQLIFDKRKAKLVKHVSLIEQLDDKNNLFDFKEVALENKDMDMHIPSELKFLLE